MERFLALTCAVAVAMLGSLSGRVGMVHGHEVDQYDIPLGQELVDHGDYWDDLLYGAVKRAVTKTNQELSDANRLVPGLRQFRLSQLDSAPALTKRVRSELPGSMAVVGELEYKLHYASAKPEQPNQVQAHFSSPWSGTYGALPFWPDPRIWNRMNFLRCSTIKVHDQYVGIDKVSHFVGMGSIYYKYYHCARMAGKSQEDAIKTAVNVGKYGPISENWLVGGIPTGIYSNADMAANYSGLKYYINITEPVVIRGQVRPAMVVFDGQQFRMQSHVQPEYFAIFVSRHWDEVLNPCFHEWTIRGKIKDRIASQRENILARYAGNNPVHRTPEYFNAIQSDCLTWFGESYGHSGHLDKLISVSQTCFDNQTTSDPALREAAIAAALWDSKDWQPLESTPGMGEGNETRVAQVPLRESPKMK